MEENQQATARENIMGTMNINPLLVKLSVPMMVSMLVQALYNVVDSIFVSHVSESALTAVSLAFSLQNVMIAVGVGTGWASTPCSPKAWVKRIRGGPTRPPRTAFFWPCAAM